MKAKNVIFGPIHENCKGCHYVISSKGRLGMAKCKVYFMPSAWWKWGITKTCPLATHLKTAPETPLGKKLRIGQQKSRKWRK